MGWPFELYCPHTKFSVTDGSLARPRRRRCREDSECDATSPSELGALRLATAHGCSYLYLAGSAEHQRTLLGPSPILHPTRVPAVAAVVQAAASGDDDGLGWRSPARPPKPVRKPKVSTRDPGLCTCGKDCNLLPSYTPATLPRDCSTASASARDLSPIVCAARVPCW